MPRLSRFDRTCLVHKMSRANQRFDIFTPNIKEFAFILGAMKSGTTSLYEYLIQHPSIAPNQFQKEPEFFSEAELPVDLDRYRRQWLPCPFRRMIALEASTGYTKMPAFPNVAERLVAVPERKHFLYIVRHPIERIESHIAHLIGCGLVRLEDIHQSKLMSHLLAVSSYATQLSAYRQSFPDVSIKILSFEDFKADPLTVVHEACRHLNIDCEFNFKVLPPQNVRSTENRANRFRLSPVVAEELSQQLAPEMHRFRDEFGFDIVRWGFS
jgi:hypothetical protein